MDNLFETLENSLGRLKERIRFHPRVAVVLGTGLGGLTEHMEVAARIPYAEIFPFAVSSVEGHKGDMVFGTLAGLDLMVMQGRFHYYEGYSMFQATLPVRVARAMGAEILVVNSAAGGLNPDFRAGDVMIVTDHINFMGDNPLRGVTDDRFGDRFPDMSRPYDEELIAIASKAAADLNIPLRHGVYVSVAGPSLETRAETRVLRAMGADAVGMSTVPEVIVGVQVGFRTMVLAAITNVNIPDSMAPLSLQQVIANAGKAEPRITAIVEETLRRVRTAGAGQGS